MLGNFGESFRLAKPATLYKLRAMPKEIQEIHHADGSRTVGNNPAYLQWSPDRKHVQWLYVDATLPDSKKRYKGLKALDHDGRPKREVVRIAHIQIEDSEIFRKRTIEIFQNLHSALESRRIKEAKLLLRMLDSSVGFALDANEVLQPIRDAVQSDSDNVVERQMDELTRNVKAARRLAEEERKAGNRNKADRLPDSEHAKFRKTVARLAQELGRAPYRKEIGKALSRKSRSAAYVNKLCKQNKCEWIPAGVRGEDNLPDRAYEKG
jgi:hypothetical protein